MNKRIQELAHEAGLPTYNPDGIPTKLEKFAELIVRECIDYMNDRTQDWDAKLRWIFNDDSGYMEVDVDSLLKEHFGVEE